MTILSMLMKEHEVFVVSKFLDGISNSTNFVTIALPLPCQHSCQCKFRNSPSFHKQAWSLDDLLCYFILS